MLVGTRLPTSLHLLNCVSPHTTHPHTRTHAQKIKRKQDTEEEVLHRLKVATQYYDVWEPPPHNKLRLRFMERVLVPRLPMDRMRNTLNVRGDYATVAKCRNQRELAEAVADVIIVEQRCLSVEQRADVADLENKVHELHVLGKPAKAKLVSNRVTKMWAPLLRKLEVFRELRRQRTQSLRDEENSLIEDRFATWREQRERMLDGDGAVLETTPRGKHKIMHLAPVTHRGPALRTPRGTDFVLNVVAGHHHAALIDRHGGLFTWGGNGSGRLGLGHRGARGTPTCVEDLEETAIRMVALGHNHSAAIAAGSNELYVWGAASEGQLGIPVEGKVWTELVSRKGFKVRQRALLC